ncbi:NtaA/DmoA family FMN-dependent monooxygenase [Citricoccus sp. GCM10030269]|uniref:NtaA/DmoA family FMN-dependent monooxygenase n=1 Tax=Citricoccus sp. GCM10030269 TaxID=3273388 RepID=UPI003620A2DA
MKPMILCALDMMVPTHQSTGMWRHPEADAEQYRDLGFWIQHAQLLEGAGFDALFFADVAGVYDVFDGSGRTAIRSGMQYPMLDPLLAVSALAAATTSLGFGVTASVSYEQPYLLARKFATLDHLTGGRIAWNIVTSYQQSAMANLGAAGQLPHDQRYDRADEFLDVTYRLWEGTFAPGALVSDAETNTYLDPDRVHDAGHAGRYFTVPGPGLTFPGPQRTPFLFQAGSSPRGLDFAVKHAEALFFSGTSPENVRQLTEGVRERLAASGRPAETLRTITSVTVITGATDDEARQRYEDYAACVDEGAALSLFAGWTGLDLAAYSPDDVLEHVDIEGNRSALQSFTTMDPDRAWTIRDLATFMAIGARGPVIVGSGATVADELERWMEVAGVDGFNVDHALRGPDLAAFARHVSPELRRRGLIPATPGAFEAPATRTLRGRLLGTDTLPAGHYGAQFRR